MTSIVQQLANEAGDALKTHEENIRTIDLLADIARLGVSNAEVGRALLDLNNGSWEETLASIKALNNEVNGILLIWTIAARLEWVERAETRGETK